MSHSDDHLPPSSSRQPRSNRDDVPLDDALPDVIDPDALPGPESVERPPASRKLAGVRGSEIDPDVEDFSRWEIDGETSGPPSTPDRSTLPAVDAAMLDVVRRGLPGADLVTLVSSTRAQRPVTFGELLDQALELFE